MIKTPLLEATMTEIRDHPELHNQVGWFTPTECGTAMCFAARTCALSGMEQVMPGTCSAMVVTPWGEQPARLAAAKVLGLDPEEANILFAPSNSRAMLELMVKDLSNGGLRGGRDYYHDLAS